MIQKLKVDTRLTVETPEGVDFEYQLAGAGLRGLALLIDLLLKLVFLYVISQFLSLLGILGGASGITDATMLLVFFVVNWLYSALFESFFHGQTPGKMIMSLRVVRTNGTPISFYEALGRNLLLAADFLPIGYTAGLVSMLATRRMQRLGDLVFDTMVVDESPDFGVSHLEFYGNVQPLNRSECQRRFDVPERTLAVIERLFEKSRFIPMERKEAIAAILADPLKNHLGFQPQATGHGGWENQTRFINTWFLHRVLITFSDHPDLISARTPLQAGAAARRDAKRVSTENEISFVGDTSNSPASRPQRQQGPFG